MWYEVKQIFPDVFEVHEPEHVSFFVLRNNSQGLFIDSGLGLCPDLAKKLLKDLAIKKFDVLNTHAHCDHVGLNYLAQNIHMYKPEWIKYTKQNENKATGIYYDLLKDHMDWPREFKKNPQHRVFKPNHYIHLNKKFLFADFILKPIRMPGHTTGSLVFYEEFLNLLFLGDFIYNGILYINLKDSSIFEFEKSVDKLNNFLFAKKNPPVLLPAHNTIPLPHGYVQRLHVFLNEIKNKKHLPKGRWPFGRFFLPSSIFLHDDLRVVIRNDQLKRWVIK